MMVFAAIRLGLNTAFCKQIIVFQLFDHPVEVRYIVVAQWQHPQRTQSRHSVRQHGRQNLFAQLVHNDSSLETKIGLEYTRTRYDPVRFLYLYCNADAFIPSNLVIPRKNMNGAACVRLAGGCLSLHHITTVRVGHKKRTIPS